MRILKMNRRGLRGLAVLSFLFVFVLVSIQGHAGEKAGKGYLGVNIEKMTGDDRDEFGVKFGVLVTDVVRDEAAFKAGLKKYDVIQYIDDVQTRRPEDVVESVGSKAPGTKVIVKYVRDGKNMSASAVLGESKKREFLIQKSGEKFRMFGDQWKEKLKKLEELKVKKTAYLGVEMREMDEHFSEYFGVKKDGGALIMAVTKDSAAEKAGLLPGDVILKIDGKPVKGPGDVSDIIREMKKGDKVKLTVFRHKKIKEMSAELDERAGFGKIFFKGPEGSHFMVPDIHIDVPKMIDEIMVWTDEEGNVHKERIMIHKEKEKAVMEMQKKKEEIRKLKEMKEKEMQEKLKELKEKEMQKKLKEAEEKEKTKEIYM